MKEMLPLGSIVSLKNGNGKLLIIGLDQRGENNQVYEYCALLHPYGYLNSEDIFLFNSDKIEKVYFKGYFDEQSKEFYEDIAWSRNRIDGGSNV